MKDHTIRADFAVIRDSEKIIRIGKSTIYVPESQFSGGNIKWFDESTYRKQSSQNSEVNYEKYNSNNP